jgi:hypothetical protein
MNTIAALTRLAGKAIAAGGLLALTLAAPGRAAVVAEGTYSINTPERRDIPFRMILTPTGARITPNRGETLVFSYEKRSALVVDHASRSYFLLPLELVPALLATGLGYDPRGLGATASGATRKLLETSCQEVTVSGREPRLTLRTCRADDPAWSRDYARLEGALGLPWAAAAPPPVFVGLPLTGSLSIEGPRPYKASWEITKRSRDAAAAVDFTVPPATVWTWSGSSPCSGRASPRLACGAGNRYRSPGACVSRRRGGSVSRRGRP